MFNDEADPFGSSLENSKGWNEMASWEQEKSTDNYENETTAIFKDNYSIDEMFGFNSSKSELPLESETKKNPTKTTSMPILSSMPSYKQMKQNVTQIPQPYCVPYPIPIKKDISAGRKRHFSAPFDDNFINICSNPNIVINALNDNLIPKKFWERNPNVTFGWCFMNFFQRKNNINTRFLYKLHNALIIDSKYPHLSSYIGATWLNNTIIKIDKHIFGRFIGIKTVDNSLFHQQGNFPSHGFVEIAACEAENKCHGANIDGVDFDNIRLFYHAPGVFVRGCCEADIVNFKLKK